MQLEITKKDYLTIKALFHVTSKDASRSILSYVYYDHSLNIFTATNGHVLRVEKPETVFNRDHYFSKNEFLKTEKMLRFMEFVQTCEGTEEEPLAYPNYKNVFPNLLTANDLTPIRAIGLSFEELRLLDKSILYPNKNKQMVTFGFQSELKGICIYGMIDEINGTMVQKFLGIIMPIRIILGHKNLPSVCPLPTLKNLTVPGQIAVIEESKALNGVV